MWKFKVTRASDDFAATVSAKSRRHAREIAERLRRIGFKTGGIKNANPTHVVDKKIAKLIPTEEWRPVLGHEKWYEVSNLGRVRSWHAPHQGRRKDPRILKPQIVKWGDTKDVHHFIGLYTEMGRDFRFVSRMVLEAFVSPRAEGMSAWHENRDRFDNRVENLRWITQSEMVAIAMSNLPRKADCSMGHPMSGDNLEEYPWRGRIIRRCKTGRRARERRRYHEKKEAK